MKNGTDFRIYLDGTSIGNTTYGSALSNHPEPLRIGASGYLNGSQFYHGYLEELRVSNGIARWVTDFTPNTRPYST